MTAPLLINVKAACAELGVSDETFRKLRQPGQAFADLKPVAGKLFYRKQLEDLLDRWTGREKHDPENPKARFDEIMDMIRESAH